MTSLCFIAPPSFNSRKSHLIPLYISVINYALYIVSFSAQQVHISTNMAESTDFGLQKEPPMLPSSLIKQLVGENELHTVTAGDEIEQNVIVTPPVPPELLKTYYCGFGPCHPKWLQFFARKKVFTILLCAFAFIQGSIVSGKFFSI